MLHIYIKLEHAYIRNVNVRWTDRQDHRLTDHVGLAQARLNDLIILHMLPVRGRDQLDNHRDAPNMLLIIVIIMISNIIIRIPYNYAQLRMYHLILLWQIWFYTIT